MLNKLKKLAESRVFIVGLLILVQLMIILVVTIQFSRYYMWYSFLSSVLTIIFVLRIINIKQNMAYKFAWTVVVFIFPAFGLAIYFIFCGNRLSPRYVKKMSLMNKVMSENLAPGGGVSDELKSVDKIAAKQSEYINNSSLCPLYRSEETHYFSSGEDLFDILLDEIEKAEKYIFLEFFIIGDGLMWGRIHDILRKKVNSGVDVRIIYDDIGCIMTLDENFGKHLESEGIKCRVFHKFIPVLSARQNNRDHRKICVIDGKTSFTGGINIADEYINKKRRFGYWKDNMVMMRGKSSWSFTVMFLTMWDYLSETGRDLKEDYSVYKPLYESAAGTDESGFVQPYTDNPLDLEPVGENVYLNIISAAHDYVWITTPYLIIDEQMEQSLCRAAKSGVDVRIITPAIPDKKIVYETTKSYYKNLIENGIKIYEFTPGFIHAKTFIADDKYATVGSVNLDYRSLYLHFECGLWMYKTDCIRDIKKDYTDTLAVCRPITEWKDNFGRSIVRGILELLAPLM